MPVTDPFTVFVIACALFLGGALKGATGAGAPVIAVPVMAAFFDVRLAVVIMVTPNLITNLWQTRQFRVYRLSGTFGWKFAIGGAGGALAGTVLLANLTPRILMLGVALAVSAYILLRFLRPDFRLSRPMADRLVWPAGLGAGVLQGAAGISAPVSVSFLNAMRLERAAFIATITVFFAVMSVGQLVAQLAYGLMTPRLLVVSAGALAMMFAGMGAGAWASRYMSATFFDRLVLGLLSVLAVRLIWVALV